MLDARDILPLDATPEAVLRAALAALARGSRVAIASVIARRGSAPSTPGQKLALSLDGDGRAPVLALGSVGGGAIERAVVSEMLAALARHGATAPRVHTFRLGPNLGMCCGGSADILVEIMKPRTTVVIVGAGHVGLATAKLLAELDFRVVCADARDAAHATERVQAAAAAGAELLLCEHDDPALAEAVGDPAEAFAITATHDHQLDQQVIEWALARGFGWVGGVGSRAKAERTRQRLAARGFAERDLARVRMPIGVSVGARRPLEIGVAIAAELVAARAESEREAAGAVEAAAIPAERDEATVPRAPRD